MQERTPSGGRSLSNHEAMCRKCGACCFQKLWIDGEVFSTTTPCRHLDTTHFVCLAYDRRFDANPDCLDVEEGIRRRVFPADCPYVRDRPDYRPDYRPPRPEVLDDEILEMIEDGEITSLPELLEAVRRRPVGHFPTAMRPQRGAL